MSVPHLFRCPISLDIFTDPVTLCTGQTYDRPCIERWLAAGHRTCPVTMQPLGDATVLVPNRTLRHLIERWLSTDQQHHNQQQQQLPEQPAAVASTGAEADAEEPSLAALKRRLEQPGAGKGKVGALRKVMTLASESDVGRACMLQLGFLPVLLQLAFHAPPSSECRGEVEELALQCALSLMPSSAASPQLGCLNALKSEASLASFVRLMERGRGRTRAGLCRLLETIATASATRELALVVAASPRVWQALVPLLQHDGAPPPPPDASEAAVRAVAAICASEPARGSAIHHGAVGALFRHLSWASSGKCAAGEAAVPSALAAVEALSASEAGRRAVARAPGAMQALVKHVFMMNSSNDGSEHAVAALLAVCRESRAARSEAAGAGVVTQLLMLLQSQCSARAKAKARSLLKLLKSM
ncbi:U-box domain-containing protein 26-like [Oryza brachyantha]|uniref:U-box domain-containing protein 26-like n=1 Tax=Oryza brachyantha TaxID=4533 RepID=UPI001ADA299F|nr:U-box domain-containing protein 26-like [Oryza brachyantha]